MLGAFPLPRRKAPGVWQMKTGQLVVLVTAEARASGVICENSDLTCISTGRSALFNFPHRPLALSHRATTRAEMAKKVADDAEPAGLTNRAELQGQIPSDLSATDLFVPKSRMPPFTCFFLGTRSWPTAEHNNRETNKPLRRNRAGDPKPSVSFHTAYQPTESRLSRGPASPPCYRNNVKVPWPRIDGPSQRLHPTPPLE